jgi:hypothetical protein
VEIDSDRSAAERLAMPAFAHRLRRICHHVANQYQIASM